MTNTLPEGLKVRLVQPKPVQMQAVLATTENLELIHQWIEENGYAATMGAGQLTIQTLSGPFTVRPGDQVLRGPLGFSREEGEESFKEAYDELGAAASD